MRRSLVVACAATFLLVTSPDLGAQARGGGNSGGGTDNIPAAYRPPPGMCRVWIPGVPPDRQSAVTSCSVAVRNRPPKGVVVYGADTTGRKTTPGTVPVKIDPTKTLPPVNKVVPGKVVRPPVPPPRRDTVRGSGSPY